jgi:2-polyprenyl-3-methyl-5-hydroxy-6-metoxy-1,4-benzoquinol methylase
VPTLVTIHFSHLTGNTGKIHAFEAVPPTYEILKKNINIKANMENNLTQINSDAYDNWHQTVHGQDVLTESKLEGWHIDALSLSPSLKDLNLLEVGCGAGDFAIHLSKQQAIVTAVDFSSKAIEIR